MNICVFGSGIEYIDDSYKKAGYKLGRWIAEHGHTLIFGAGSTGVMGAVAEGAYRAGGRTIGILPEKLNETSTPFEHLNKKIVTKTMHERKQLMESLADIFVICPGGFGTFEEIAEVISLKRLGYFNTPIIFLNMNGYYDKLFEMFDVLVNEKFGANDVLSMFEIVSTPEEVLELIKKLSK